MKNDELMDAWNDINTEFIEEADHLRRNGKKNAGRKRLVTLLAAAAVLTLAIGTAAVMIIRSSTGSGNPAADSGSAVSSGETRETVTAISEEPSEDLSTVTAAAVSDTTEAEEGWWEAEGVYIKCYRNELVEIDNQGPTVMLSLSDESLGVLAGLTTGDRILVRISGDIQESWPGSCGPCEVEALSQGSYNDILPTIEQLNEAGWKVIYDGDLNEAVTVQERVEQLLDELNAKYADEGFSINLDDHPVGDDWWEELSMMSVDALREYLEKFYTDEPPIMLYGAGTDELDEAARQAAEQLREEAAKAAEEARAAAQLEASQNEAEQEASRNEEESDSVPPITEIASRTMSSLAARLKGCTREELRAAWGEPLESLEWNPDYPVDIWRIGEGADQLSVDVQYDKDGKVINGYTYLAADQPTIW